MIKIKLFLNKDVNENANFYFKKSKKLKAKIPGIDTTIEKTQKQINEFEEQKQLYVEKKDKQQKLKIHKKKEWFEKFRYTKLSSGHLLVCGKDSGTNEVLIKKHAEENDIILHTESPGSPFGIIKDGKGLDKEIIYEAAQFICCFSSQWKKGFGTADAFWVTKDQVSKKAVSGEYMAKGAFMIYGQKNMLKNIVLRICLGVENKKIITEEGEQFEYKELFSGSEKACRKYCIGEILKIEPGNLKAKMANKEIRKRLKIQIEDLPKYIPNDLKILKK